MRTNTKAYQNRKIRQIVWTTNNGLTPINTIGSRRLHLFTPLHPTSTSEAILLPDCSWSKKAQEYSQYSSLHGLRYIGDTKLHYCERFFWIIAFLLAVIASGYFISNIFQKWTEMPVIMTLSPTATSIASIPFPAVTICNMNNVRKSAAKQILQRVQDNPNDKHAKLEETFLQERCNYNSNYDNSSNKYDNRTGEWNYVKAFMRETSQPCEDMLAACFWHKETRLCNEIFSPTLTDEGICCSFNKIKRDLIFRNPKHLSDLNYTFTYPSVDWSAETGYPINTPHEHIPWRPWGTGSHLGFTVVLDAEHDEYYCSSEASLGFKVLLHNPVETPKMTAFGFAVSSGRETRLDISPRIMTSTQQLKSISVKKRNCLFNYERYLRFFRVYTERNCNVECEANFTLYFCNCVQYYMPKDKLTRICGKRDLKCALLAQQTMEMIAAHIQLNSSVYQNLTKLGKCECLPSCYDLDYSIVQSTSSLTKKATINQYFVGRNRSYFQKNMAVLHMFFTEAQFTGIQRGVLFGFTEFLSNTGGLLGLFMGFSFLSTVEAFYFLSLRVWCSIIRETKPEYQRRNSKVSQLKIPFPYTE